MTKFRISIAATLMVASLICTALALTKQQAGAICIGKYEATLEACYKKWPNGTMTDAQACEHIAASVYKNCMADYGYRGTNPPVPRTPPPKTTGTPKPTPPPKTQGNPRPTATPPQKTQGDPNQIFAKPKATPTPHKDHKH